jgi:fumarylacetoacetate (FAA) hydrolase
VPAVRLVTFGDGVGELVGDRIRVLAAASILDLLAWGTDVEEAGWVEARRVQLRAPVPEPPSVRDFFAYEGHVAAGWRRRGGEIPPYWYEAPVFYFTNPAAVVGPGAPVRRPEGCEWLDFELEIAAVIGAGGAIAGFTLMNDWSARDIQAGEMSVGLGPAKAKDFATSLGPWLATPDELPIEDGRLQLEATVSVNGEVVSACDASLQHWSWDEIVEQAARNTRLRPGDVLGSGTLTGGCILELGIPWLEDGDEVTLAAPGLGELANTVAG